MMELTGKRIAATGGAGFLGSFVVDALRARRDRPRWRDHDLVAGRVPRM